MKAVLRKAGGTVSGEEKQFLEVSLQGRGGRQEATGEEDLRRGRQPDTQVSSGLGEEPEAQEFQPVGAGEARACL